MILNGDQYGVWLRRVKANGGRVVAIADHQHGAAIENIDGGVGIVAISNIDSAAVRLKAELDRTLRCAGLCFGAYAVVGTAWRHVVLRSRRRTPEARDPESKCSGDYDTTRLSHARLLPRLRLGGANYT